MTKEVKMAIDWKDFEEMMTEQEYWEEQEELLQEELLQEELLQECEIEEYLQELEDSFKWANNLDWEDEVELFLDESEEVLFGQPLMVGAIKEKRAFEDNFDDNFDDITFDDVEGDIKL